ncbi:hypothetical protein GOP47_0001020 [Adiantum capillus-veneris]|uniref:Uncharacterized protein n=1 Tax=Adiantum capillus-veneris TaxID=13818 RepID=A0A9D4ZSU0_ADICA|nr:hypothetical protein GOP47_0001020 [Adiantum capillus-veneris]
MCCTSDGIGNLQNAMNMQVLLYYATFELCITPLYKCQKCLLFCVNLLCKLRRLCVYKVCGDGFKQCAASPIDVGAKMWYVSSSDASVEAESMDFEQVSYCKGLDIFTGC